MTTLQTIERRIATAPAYQLVVRTIFDQAPMIERQDAVGKANRRQAVGNDEHRAPLSDLRHVLLDDPLAFIVERAGGFIEDQDARLAQQRARNCDALALPAGESCCRARRRSCRSPRKAPE